MFRIAQGQQKISSDVEALIAMINGKGRCTRARDMFNEARRIVVTRAPGRLDVMGGIADYSGSHVLQLPIREAVCAAIQRQADRQLHIVSLGSEGEPDRDSRMDLADLESNGQPIEYDAARDYFRRKSASSWAGYVAGAFLVLMREKTARFDDGARLLIQSDVPEGKGVSSSAALEVATMQAIAAAYEIAIEPSELAILCQKVENLIVGAPCGVMDQMTASCGGADELLSLRCQPAELLDPVAIPDEIALWGIDSGVRHAVSGSDYTSVRVGAFMGYRIIADLAGLAVRPSEDGEHVIVDDAQWQGYLANLVPTEFEKHFASHLPERMEGQAFLDRYGGTTDRVTEVEPEWDYAVRTSTAHPVYENDRVCRFAEMLQGEMTEAHLEQLGTLMFESHASYSACGLGCDGTDLLVAMVRETGPAAGLYGAKITGGGSGGTVAILGRADSGDAVRQIADRYTEKTGLRSCVFAGSSEGAADFGHLVLESH